MDALRLRLKKVDGVIKQYVSNEEPKKVKILDYTNLSKEEIDEKLTRKTSRSFWNKYGELYDISIVKAPDNITGVYTKVNHVSMDAWGLTVFIKDVVEVYAALKENRELPKPPAQFTPIIEKELEYLKSKKYEKDYEFWKETFKELPNYAAIDKEHTCNMYRPSSLRFKTNLKTIVLEKEKFEKIKDFCKEYRLSPQSLFLLGSQLYFYKLNNTDESLVNNVLARRGSVEAKNAGGMLINILEFKVKCPHDLSFLEACKKIMIDQGKLFRHGDFPYQKVVDFLHEKAGIKHGSFADFTLTYQAAKADSSHMLKGKIQNYDNRSTGVAVYLTIMDILGTGNLEFMFQYNIAMASEEIVDKIYNQMINSILIGIENPNKTLKEIMDET